MFRLSRRVQELGLEAKGKSGRLVFLAHEVLFHTSVRWLLSKRFEALQIHVLKVSVRTLCKDMFLAHEVLLFHTSVRWLKVRVRSRVFEMKGEIKLFSELKANEYLSYISDKIWLKCLIWLKILKN